MTNFFMKKLNKKGFTLAELLIVVAIIAILIAVAIPIYTGAMKEAQKKVNMSNARALRGAATSEILMHWTETDGTNQLSTGAAGSTTGGKGKGWIAWATFDQDGTMGTVEVRVRASTVNDDDVGSKGYVSSNTSVTNAETEIAKTDGTVDEVSGEKSGNITNKNTIIITLSSTEIKHTA